MSETLKEIAARFYNGLNVDNYIIRDDTAEIYTCTIKIVVDVNPLSIKIYFGDVDDILRDTGTYNSIVGTIVVLLYKLSSNYTPLVIEFHMQNDNEIYWSNLIWGECSDITCFCTGLRADMYLYVDNYAQKSLLDVIVRCGSIIDLVTE